MRVTGVVRVMALLALLTGMAAAGVKYVAVVESDIDEASGASEKISRADVRLVTAELRREAVKNLPPKRYSIMTAETVMSMGGAVLEECAEENCVIALGSRIGADYIVRGTVSKFQTMFTLGIELYETENGTLVIISRGKQEENATKIWIRQDGSLEVANNNSRLTAKELANALEYIDANKNDIIAQWYQYFGI
jgi:hypothetical protein